jgi:hypothetical protein
MVVLVMVSVVVEDRDVPPIPPSRRHHPDEVPNQFLTGLWSLTPQDFVCPC